jgi:hypothetical protein
MGWEAATLTSVEGVLHAGEQLFERFEQRCRAGVHVFQASADRPAGEVGVAAQLDDEGPLSGKCGAQRAAGRAGRLRHRD